MNHSPLIFGFQRQRAEIESDRRSARSSAGRSNERERKLKVARKLPKQQGSERKKSTKHTHIHPFLLSFSMPLRLVPWEGKETVVPSACSPSSFLMMHTNHFFSIFQFICCILYNGGKKEECRKVLPSRSHWKRFVGFMLITLFGSFVRLFSPFAHLFGLFIDTH